MAKPSHIQKRGGRFCSNYCYVETRWATPIEERLRAVTSITDTCWLMTSGLDKDGYGRIKMRGRQPKAHQVAWWLATGEWPTKDQVVCHVCDVRNCVRNDDEGTYEVLGVLYPRRGHLWLGTPSANSADMAQKGRAPSGDQHARRINPSRWENAPRRGADHYAAQHTDDEIREIRRRWANRHIVKVTQEQLAAEYHLRQPNISAIVNGRAWKHLQ